jgi:hypothetical protein
MILRVQRRVQPIAPFDQAAPDKGSEGVDIVAPASRAFRATARAIH